MLYAFIYVLYKNCMYFHRNFQKLVIAEGFVKVLASCSDDGYHLVLGQLVSYVSHQMLELLSVDGAAPVLVQRPEGQPHHLLVIVAAHLCWRK